MVILIPPQVNIYQMYSRYIEDVPSIFVSLYLGPLSGKSESVKMEQDGIGLSLYEFSSDSGRKPIMLVPFLGHIISGTLMILVCLFPAWDARCPTLKNKTVICPMMR